MPPRLRGGFLTEIKFYATLPIEHFLYAHKRGREMAKPRRKDSAEHVGLYTKELGEVFLIRYKEAWFLFRFDFKHGEAISFSAEKLSEMKDGEEIRSRNLTFSDPSTLKEADLSAIAALVTETEYMKARAKKLEEQRRRNSPTAEEKEAARRTVMARIHEKVYTENDPAGAFAIASAYKISPEAVKEMIREMLTNGIVF